MGGVVRDAGVICDVRSSHGFVVGAWWSNSLITLRSSDYNSSNMKEMLQWRLVVGDSDLEKIMTCHTLDGRILSARMMDTWLI